MKMICDLSEEVFGHSCKARFKLMAEQAGVHSKIKIITYRREAACLIPGSQGITLASPAIFLGLSFLIWKRE
jgi:hypothetical protein